MFKPLLCNIIIGSCLLQFSRTATSAMNSKIDKDVMINSMKKCIPPLNKKSHKGQAGRIGIIGGSLEYTGAPYFAAISALKVGADLVHIFCPSLAATVIKTYSPELIVHPLLDDPNAVAKITPWFERLHAIVIGPGLGRNADTFNVVSDLISTIKEKKIPLVIDADGLFLVTEIPELIKDFKSPVILTPNEVESGRLCSDSVGLCNLTGRGSNISILVKGSYDEFYSELDEVKWKNFESGSGRRCGGQGDILSGSIATLLNWTLSKKSKIDVEADQTAAAVSIASYAGSLLVRKCNEKAFAVKKRSMLASDMIEYISESFEEIFDA